MTPKYAFGICFKRLGALPFAALVGLAGAPETLMAQSVVESYIAEIAPQDRVNSRGVALTDPAAILAQDRANFHRFRIRQAGDGSDGMFLDPAARGSMPGLVARGQIAADARAAIVGPGTVQVRVDVLRGGGGDFVNVRLAEETSAPATATATGGAATPALPVPSFGLTTPVGTTIAAGWALENDMSGMRGIASVRTAEGARVAFECTRQGADAAAFTGPGVLLAYQEGTLNLMVAAAAFPALSIGVSGQQFNVSLSVDGQPIGATAMAALPEAAALGTSIPGTHPVFAQLADGTTMTLQEASTGAQAIVPLTGLSATLDSLRAVCAQPAGQPPATAPPTALPQIAQPAPVQTPAPQPTVTPPPAVAPDTTVVSGNDAVAERLALWLIGQRPALMNDYTTIFNVAGANLSGYPGRDPSQVDDPTYMPRLGAEIAARAATETLPGMIEMDLQVRLARQGPSMPFQVRFPAVQMPLTNYELQPSVPDAIRVVQMQLPFRFGQVLLRETDPMPLVLPDAIANMEVLDYRGQPSLTAFLSAGTFLRTTFALSDPRVPLPVDVTRPTLTTLSTEIRATVQKVVLIRRIVNSDRSVDETTLATWERGDAPAGGAAPTVPAFAERYARGLQGGRILAASPAYQDAVGLLRTIPATGQGIAEARNAAVLLTKTAAILARYPDRRLSDAALLELLFVVVDPITRDRIVPPGFRRRASDSNMNTLMFAQALLQAEPQVRAYVAANGPSFPLDIRMRALATLGEYDLTSQLFSWQLLGNVIGFLDGYGTRVDIRDAVATLPDTLAVTPADANALIQALEIDTIPSRMIPVRLDYTVTAARARPGGTGEITLDEVRTVELDHRLGELQVFADLEETVVLLTHAFPAPDPLSDAQRIPEAIYETTPQAVWATWARATGEAGQLRTYVTSRRAFGAQSHSLSESQRAALADTETARIAALARDQFWVGLSFEHGAYDPAEGMLEVRNPNIRTLPYAVSGRDANVPDALFSRENRPEALPMTPEEYAVFQTLVQGSRTAFALALVGPAAEQTTGRFTLTVTRPKTVLILQAQGSGAPDRVALRVEVGAPPSLAAAVPDVLEAGSLTPPERILLDSEGLDLLALSRDPQIYGDAGFRRMLVERLALERLAAQSGEALPWGAFFSNPGIAIRPQMIDQVLPAFTEWTQARAAALPMTVVVPYGINGGVHPVTLCRAAQRLPDQGFANRTVVTQLAALAPQADPGQQQPQILDQVARPGPMGVIAVSGRGVHPNGNCGHVAVGSHRSDLNPDATGIDFAAAGYVDALVIADYPVAPRPEGARAAALDYVVSLDDVALRRVAPDTGDQPGLRGVLVITGEVTVIDQFIWDSRTRSYPRGATIESEAWLSLLPDQDRPLPDILGLTVGAPLADVAALAEERISGLIRHVSPPQAERRVYGDAVGFSAPDRSEVLLSIYDAADEAQAAIALMRYRYFAPGTMTLNSVQASLVEKYGAPDVVVGETLMWGVPPQQVDNYGVCGGQRTFRGREGVPMQADLPDEEARQRRTDGTYVPPEWSYYGWPIPYASVPTLRLELARPFCGPAVLARIRTDVYEPGSVDLTVWLLDTNEAEQRAVIAPEPEAANIDL